jgi:TP901 family phage tail tape measure protein
VAGAESFTVLAILEARDAASEIFAKVDESLDKFSDTAVKAADAAKGAGDSIDDSLLKTASGADALDLASARVEATQARLAQTTQAVADAERDVLAAHQEAAAAADEDTGSTDALVLAEARLAGAQRDQAAAAKLASDAQKVQADTAVAAAAKNDEAAVSTTAVKDASEAGGISLGTMGKIAGITALGLGVAGALMVKAAGNFQDSTTHLVTDAGESAKNLGMVQAGILNVSTATGQSASSITDAMYHIESGGMHAQEGLDVLKVAAEGARVGGADLDTVSKTLVGSLNAYYGSSMNAGNATQRSASMMNELIATVAAGDMRMQDLAGSLSSVAPIAAKAGLSMAQVGGAIATMTSQGMTAQNATQELAHTITSLQNPTTVQTNEMAQLGLSSMKVASNLGHAGLTGTITTLTQAITSHMGKAGTVLMSAFNQSTSAAKDAQIMLAKLPPSIQSVAKGYLDGSVSYSTWYAAVKTQPLVARSMATEFAATASKAKGFNSILTAGGPAAQTYTAALAKMTGGQTGLKVSLMLSGKSAGVFSKNVADIAAAAKKGGDQVDNWSTIQGTFNFKVSQAKTGIENTGIAIGTALLPAVTSVISAVTKVVIPVAEWTAKNKTLTEIIFVAVTAFAAMIAVIAIAKKAFDAVSGAVKTVQATLKALGILSKETAATQKASAESAAAAQEEASAESAAAQESDAAEVAAANDEAAAESSGSWLAAAANQIATGIEWAARSAAQLAVVVAQNVAAAATTAASWVAAGAQQVAGAAVWVAQSIAKVAVIVASNVAGAAVTMAAWIAANAAMLLGIGLIVAAVAAAVYLIVTHWRQISDAAKEAFDFVVHIAETVFDWVKAHWPLLLGILTGPFGLAAGEIIQHYKVILKAVSDAIDWVKAHWPLLLAILTGPIGLATLFIVKHWDQIVDGAASMLGRLGSWFRSLPGLVMGWIKDLPSLLFGSGAHAIESLADGIMSAAGGALHSAMSFVANTVKSFLPFSPAKQGPLSGAGDPSNSGKSIAKLLAKGMVGGVGDVTAASHLLASSAALGEAGHGGGLALTAGGGYGGGAGSGGVNITVDLRGASIMSDSDINKLVRALGPSVVKALAQAGVKVRMP